MKIPRHVISSKLRERGKTVRADWVDRTLPEEVDFYDNRSLLATLELSAEDLAGSDHQS